MKCTTLSMQLRYTWFDRQTDHWIKIDPMKSQKKWKNQRRCLLQLSVGEGLGETALFLPLDKFPGCDNPMNRLNLPASWQLPMLLDSVEAWKFIDKHMNRWGISCSRIVKFFTNVIKTKLIQNLNHEFNLIWMIKNTASELSSFGTSSND